MHLEQDQRAPSTKLPLEKYSGDLKKWGDRLSDFCWTGDGYGTAVEFDLAWGFSPGFQNIYLSYTSFERIDRGGRHQRNI